MKLSQAAVGQQMKRLEQTLNVALFDRTGNTPELNSLANALVPKARAVVHAYDTLLDEVIGNHVLFGEFTLGAVASTIRGLVPLSIKDLLLSHPELHIRVVPGLSGDLHEQVERGAVDAAILSEPARISKDLQWHPFVREELVLLVSAEVEESDPIELLSTLPYVAHTRRAAVGMLADKWLLRQKISVSPSMEMESLASCTSMVSHNLGISIVPNVCVPDQIFAGLRKIPLPDSEEKRVLGVLNRADSSKIRLTKLLAEKVKNTVEAHKQILQ